jgi:hypothetical protein
MMYPQIPERLKRGATGGKKQGLQQMVLQNPGRAIVLSPRACSIQDKTEVFGQL